MPSEQWLQAITELTKLVATYGVYAILVIGLFYLLRWATRQLRQAPDSEKRFFEKVLISVLVADFVLMGLAVWIWYYANYVYFRKTYVQGSVTGLAKRPLEPTGELVQQILPESSNVDFFESRGDSPSEAGTYVQQWVLLPRAKFSGIVFTFQHRYTVPARHAASLEPVPNAPPGTDEKRTITKKFRLDLEKMGYSPSTPFELVYLPDSRDPVKTLGTMSRRVPATGKLEKIDWEDATATASEHTERYKNGPIFPFFSTLLASAAPVIQHKPLFGEDGQYDQQTGRALRYRLGSSDLKTQLEARRILVESGKRCFRFVQDSLSLQRTTKDNKIAQLSPEPHYDRSVLVQNLASAVEEIEAQRVPVPPRLQLELALALYRLNDHQAAARFFQKAGDGPVDRDDIYFYRAFAYSEVGRNEDALRSYEQYLKRPISASAKAAAHFNMGVVLDSMHRDQDAIRNYKKAIAFYSQYGDAHNNLAYLYADRGINLTEALSEANRALAIKHDDPNFKDTKGWVLYKMGRYKEARGLLLEAVNERPDDEMFQGHLQAIEEASRQTAKKNQK
jgi:tetratricopeptide (TPR) repeat protein